MELEYLGHDQVLMRYILPLAEVVVDFYDILKSVTKGYASLEYVSDGYQVCTLNMLPTPKMTHAHG